jgi:hypothetical protein
MQMAFASSGESQVMPLARQGMEARCGWARGGVGMGSPVVSPPATVFQASGLSCGLAVRERLGLAEPEEEALVFALALVPADGGGVGEFGWSVWKMDFGVDESIDGA